MSRSEKIFDETFTARNFNTTPLVISGLEGDTYDYHIIQVEKGSPNDSGAFIRLNADTGANYRNYMMRGYNSTTNAVAGDTETSIGGLVTYVGQAKNAIGMYSITGDSSKERYIKVRSSGIDSSARTYSNIRGFHWKNTVDELTSITFGNSSGGTYDSRITIYRTLKEASHNWELVEVKTLSSSDIFTTPLDFSGLDGDSDIQYKIDIDITTSAAERLQIQPNADSGSNYIRQQLRNIGGSLSASNSTSISSMRFASADSGTIHRATFIINAESGAKRLATCTYSGPTTSDDQAESTFWWSNTVDNLTSLRLLTNDSSSCTGTVKLYRQKRKSSDPLNLPFEVIGEVEVSGDFSAGHTFSDLTGDSTTLYKLEFLGKQTGSGGPEPYLHVQFNGDTGANYPFQSLRGVGGTASAASGTVAHMVMQSAIEGQSSSSLYIYPQSGGYRPALGQSNYLVAGIYAIWNHAYWWNNSVDQITSIKVFASQTRSLTGTLKLSRLR